MVEWGENAPRPLVEIQRGGDADSSLRDGGRVTAAPSPKAPDEARATSAEDEAHAEDLGEEGRRRREVSTWPPPKSGGSRPRLARFRRRAEAECKV